MLALALVLLSVLSDSTTCMGETCTIRVVLSVDMNHGSGPYETVWALDPDVWESTIQIVYADSTVDEFPVSYSPGQLTMKTMDFEELQLDQEATMSLRFAYGPPCRDEDCEMLKLICEIPMSYRWFFISNYTIVKVQIDEVHTCGDACNQDEEEYFLYSYYWNSRWYHRAQMNSGTGKKGEIW